MNLPAKKLTRSQRQEAAAIIAELERRQQKATAKTIYGLYEPTGEYGGRLVKCLQEQSGEYVEITPDQEPDVKLPIKLEKVLTTEARFIVLFGGRGGAKTLAVGNILASDAHDYGHKTLCMREHQNTIEDSVHAALSQLVSERHFDDVKITENAIRQNGQDWFKYRGLAKNPLGIQSAFGFKRGWTEEAQTISQKSLRSMTPTFREEGSQIIFTMNPLSSADPMSARFIEPFMIQLKQNGGIYEDHLHLVIWINYDENPWHRELETERRYDEEHMSEEEYGHVWLGHYNDSIQNAIIPTKHFDAAIDAHVKLGFKGEGARIASHDPSDEGDDDKGYALRHGSVILRCEAMDHGDVNDGSDWALGEAIKDQADVYVWDADGLGLGLKRDVSKTLDGKHMDWVMFHGGGSVEQPDSQYMDTSKHDSAKSRTNKEAFHNKRAQMYTRLADRFAMTYRAVTKGEYINPDDLISLSGDIGESNLSQLRSELCRIPLKPNNNGKIQIMSKEEMARKPLELPSPNMGDAVMQTMITPPRSSKAAKVKRKTRGWRH